MKNSVPKHHAAGLTKAEIVGGLHRVGLKACDVVLVHAAMRTLGHVDGGAETVVEALLEVLGKHGTLVVPTFTSAHYAAEDPIVDPENDPSEMGIISQTVKTRPDALKSIAYSASFAAVGRRAEVITQVDPSLTVFDLRSSFGVMLALNTQILLLGVPYQSSTSHHFAEYVCDVPYRHTIDLGEVKFRRKDGSIVMQRMTEHVPLPGAPALDYHKLGRMLEEQGSVSIGAIGNAVARRYAMRDLIDLAQTEAEKDYSIFLAPEGDPHYRTPLEFGKIVKGPKRLDSGGWVHNPTWYVMDESKLVMPDV